ncbi:hypothetical protein N0V84_008436 [Fusarium piperis]|uniref:Uncharacterized protein n=1 Tax=Fusarium piperis TaxID=1435070 RepID=A0A9W9BJW0_9HYPO|nr:hypothetical protein N0V84_008436 [Fusarium piperis]
MSTTQHQVAKGQPSGPKSQYEASREAQIDAYLAGSDSRATDTAAIQHRTLKCHALFESCQSNSNRSGDDWLDKMSAEFNWWSLGIGAAKGGHSSLDYRVQTREDVRNTLVNLLESLATSLNKYIDAVHGHPNTRANSGASSSAWLKCAILR